VTVSVTLSRGEWVGNHVPAGCRRRLHSNRRRHDNSAWLGWARRGLRSPP